MKLIWLIHVLALSESGYRILGNDISLKYVNVNTWETVILPCQLPPFVVTMVWRRGNYYLFKELKVNSNATRNSRYAIVGNQQEGEYNLQITNTTEKDSGIYVCDLQFPNNITSTKYLLTLKESFSVAVQSSSWTKESFITDRNSWKPITFISTYRNEKEVSTLEETRLSTEYNRSGYDKEFEKETELSFREMFYYGLLAAGLVLVLFLSTLCNACVNRKCGMAIHKTTETITHDNNTHAIEDNNENIEITERNDIISLYEAINENEMLPDSLIVGRNSKPSQKSTPIDLSEKPYFEIDNSYLDVIPPDAIDQSKITVHIQIESSTATDISDLLHRINIRKTVSESSSSSEESVKITGSKGDGYLNPYVALKTDEIEYLHSYSTPCLIPVEISTMSVNSSGSETDDDYYTDGFSPKEVITKV